MQSHPYGYTAVLLTLVALPIGVRKLRGILLAKETGLVNLDQLGRERKPEDKIHGTAVVCGGSIAGLLAARVCHSHFERVLIVEPEEWLMTPEAKTLSPALPKKSRARVMQYDAIHGNVASFYLGVSNLFPGIKAACKEAKIRIAPCDFKFNIWGIPFILPKVVLDTFWASRRGTETLIRRLCLDSKLYPNIEQIPGTVSGFDYSDAAKSLISSVDVRRSNGTIEKIDAALVIDCTGPSQAGLKCLRRGNPDLSPFNDFTSRFDPDMRYASFTLSIPPEKASKIPIPGGWDSHPGGIYMLLPEPPHEAKYISAFRYEGDEVVVCVGSWGPVDLPENVDGIKDFVRSISVRCPIPEWFYDFLDVCVDLRDTVDYCHIRCPASYWVHYEKMMGLPSNWVASGDSVSRFNPVYASGSPKSLFGALTLNTLLGSVKGRGLPQDFSRRFFNAQAAKIEGPWLAAKIHDYGYSSTVPEPGEDLSAGSLIGRYIRRLQILSWTDPQIGAVIWENISIVGVSIDMFHPKIVAKVIYHFLTNPNA